MADHPLLAEYPLAGQIDTSQGPQPIPYTVSEGHCLFLTGSGDATEIGKALTSEDVHPVTDQSGRAALGLFLCLFARASSGPHLELHLGALVAPQPECRISDQAEGFLAAFGTQPDWGFASIGLWNDTPGVVALNTDYFGLGAARMKGDIAVAPDQVKIDLKTMSGTPLILGQVRRPRASQPASLWRLARLMGWRAFLTAGRAERAEAHVINRKCAHMPQNRRARTLTAADKITVSRWNAQRDHMTTGLPFRFTPRIVQHLSPFRFVYLHPDHNP